MSQIDESDETKEAGRVADLNAPVLVTGAGGFIGPHVVAQLLQRGFRHIRCLSRPSSGAVKLQKIAGEASGKVSIIRGNLLSRADCVECVSGVQLVYHLAAGRGEKSYPDAYMNSVVTSRNLLDAVVAERRIRRFVSVGSFAVYSNRGNPVPGVLDENSPVEKNSHLRGEAYCFAKMKQDELVMEYGRKHSVPFVILRPGYVYGPGNEGISSRVGIGTFGLFLHLGGPNLVPLSYVENCAHAIVLAGVVPGVNGEIFNVVDDNLVTSRQFLRLYKRHVKHFASLYLPGFASYLFCWAWEWYSNWSQGQLPDAYNRLTWHAYWKGSRYSNAKVKRLLGWSPLVPTPEALMKHFGSCREKLGYA